MAARCERSPARRNTFILPEGKGTRDGDKLRSKEGMLKRIQGSEHYTLCVCLSLCLTPFLNVLQSAEKEVPGAG